jgi:hypothetical protein
MALFDAFDARLRGGVWVTGGNGLILAGAGPSTPTPSGLIVGPLTTAFTPDGTAVNNGEVFDSGFGGGVRVATFGGDAVFGAGLGGGSQVRILRPDSSVVREFFAFPEDFTGGVFVG